MNQPLKGKRIAVLIANNYEDLELWYPTLRLRAAGAEVQLVGEKAGEAYTGSHGYPAQSDVAASDVRADEFDGVVIPGGFAPDRMRRNPAMVGLVRDLNRSGKLVAAICHAGWMLAEADIVRGRRATCVSAIKTDLVNAGAQFEDAEVVVDRNLVTSRTPGTCRRSARSSSRFWLARRPASANPPWRAAAKSSGPSPTRGRGPSSLSVSRSGAGSHGAEVRLRRLAHSWLLRRSVPEQLVDPMKFVERLKTH